jgi:CRP-like cAMP-binding protein
MTAGLPSSRLITRLRCVTDISVAAERLVASLPIVVRNFAADDIIVPQGATPSHCGLVLDGFVARERPANAANRQILSFYVPGDIPDANTLHLPKMDHSLVAIGPAVAGFIPHEAMLTLLAQSPQLLHAFWRETLIDAAMVRQWVVNLGQREGVARVAHLVCELAVRLDVVGLLRDRTLPIPWTQSDVADATGMTSIHANRMIQELRTRGLLQWEGRQVRILDWEGLLAVAGFSADYLHFKRSAGSLPCSVPEA